MSNDVLNQQIRDLTAALSRAPQADAATRKLLHGLQGEIARVTEHHEPVTERLEEIAVRFEADHPAVGTALREAINALSKAGI
jgi:Domain of unknown function (DUF4404)